MFHDSVNVDKTIFAGIHGWNLKHFIAKAIQRIE
jgi:hypothetical protein